MEAAKCSIHIKVIKDFEMLMLFITYNPENLQQFINKPTYCKLLGEVNREK